MQKIKPLRPSMREKKRYLVYRTSSSYIPISELVDDINGFLGVFDAAEAGVMAIKDDKSAKKGIMKVNNRYTDKARIALMLSAGEDEILEVLGSSGILKKAEQIYFAS